MDNDLFTATETLHSAFEEVLRNENKVRKWSVREHYRRLRQALTHRKLTVSEKLLLCYGSGEELFPSREGKKQSEQEARKKRQDIFREHLELLTKFCELPEEEQERIRQEVFEEENKIPDDKPLETRSTRPLELNSSKDSKNGK